ncbi:MAG: metallophosphoesterase [Candidatus Methanoperedens sp.]|nr:metallophosphoesterase [Candidatus Methanoperedens sp.]
MRILAIADTHIKHGSINDQLPDDLIRLIKEADMLIHAGDFISKQAFDELSTIAELESVHGNMDDPVLKGILPERKVIEVEGMNIGIIHEAALSIQDTTGARYMAKEMGADVLIFGHIHKPIIERSDVLLVCPGSPTSPRLSEAAAVELVIEQGRISGKIITLPGARCF